MYFVGLDTVVMTNFALAENSRSTSSQHVRELVDRLFSASVKSVSRPTKYILVD